MPSPLSCSAQPVTARFPPHDSSWSAHEAIEIIERTRSQLVKPVPFFLYDEPLIPTSVAAELKKMETCGAARQTYHYGGEYWFLRQLVNHRWRVRKPEDAELLVVPSLATYQIPRGPAGGLRAQYCRGLTSISSITAAIGRTEMWRTRQHDHVYTGLDWERSCLPGFPPLVSTKHTGGDGESPKHHHPHNSSTSCMVGSGQHPPMLRAFVESHWSDPLLHSTYVPSPQPRVDWLIPAPCNYRKRLNPCWTRHTPRTHSSFYHCRLCPSHARSPLCCLCASLPCSVIYYVVCDYGSSHAPCGCLPHMP